MNSFGQAAKRRQIKNAVRDEMLNYAEHFDLCMLSTVRRKFGCGRKRLREFYEEFCEIYNEMQRRYYDKDDVKVFGSRSDTYVMKERLKAIGFDYDVEVKILKEV